MSSYATSGTSPTRLNTPRWGCIRVSHPGSALPRVGHWRTRSCASFRARVANTNTQTRVIPLSDELPTTRTPWMTYLILIVMFLVWIFVQGAGFDQQALAASVCNLGMVPGELTHMAPVGEAVPLGKGLACVVDNDQINVL